MEKTASKASSKRPKDFMKSPSLLSNPRHTKESRVEMDVAPSDDEEYKIVRTQAARCPIPKVTYLYFSSHLYILHCIF